MIFYSLKMWPSFINSISFSGDHVHPWLQSINGLLTMVVDHRSKSWDNPIQKKSPDEKFTTDFEASLESPTALWPFPYTNGHHHPLQWCTASASEIWPEMLGISQPWELGDLISLGDLKLGYCSEFWMPFVDCWVTRNGSLNCPGDGCLFARNR